MYRKWGCINGIVKFTFRFPTLPATFTGMKTPLAGAQGSGVPNPVGDRAHAEPARRADRLHLVSVGRESREHLGLLCRWIFGGDGCVWVGQVAEVSTEALGKQTRQAEPRDVDFGAEVVCILCEHDDVVEVDLPTLVFGERVREVGGGWRVACAGGVVEGTVGGHRWRAGHEGG